MRQIKLIMCTAVLLIAFSCHAQDHCLIYGLVLDSVYSHENSGTYYVVADHSMDPTSSDTSWRKNPQKMSIDHKLYIGQSFYPFELNAIGYLERLTKAKVLHRETYSVAKQSSLTCPVSSRYCAIKVPNEWMDSINFQQKDTCLIDGKMQTRPKQFFVFSNILYSADGKTALVLVDIKSQSRTIRYDYGVILRKSKHGNWMIYKMGGEYTL